ncbi:hypothetical protein CXQ81_20065 [Pseudomonas sp. 09C 129]|nr:PAAR-like domain-containing protein [Pseudomonas sp. 09C 129]AUG02808.1 hypothetical protein CXQ81_20065 [Pseudomonas sp. 09C 129]
MGNEVYANNMEVSCKAAAGKSVACFPDVCFTPPQAPPTPMGVPIPYPNTGMAKDTTRGTRTVKITRKEVMLKDKSYFKTSYGDEAGCAPKKGIITSKIKGKVYFTSWSMDVKFEGENVVRHMDMTTHNHASLPGNTPPWMYMDAMSMPEGECKEQTKKTTKCMEKHVKQNTHKDKRKAHHKPGTTKKAAMTDDAAVDWTELLEKDAGKGEFYNKKGARESMCKDDDCKDQFQCNLVPFDFGCCGGQTPHHVVPAHCFLPSGERKSETGARYPGTEKYDDVKAPCICLEGATKSDSDAAGNVKEHGRVHAIVDVAEDKFMNEEKLFTPTGKPKMEGGQQAVKKTAGTWNFAQANKAGCDAISSVKGCDSACMQAQSESAHKQMGLDVGPGKSDKLMLRADSFGTRTPEGFVPKSNTNSGAGM